MQVGAAGRRDDHGGPETRRDVFVEALWWPPGDKSLMAQGKVSAFGEGSVWLDTEADAWGAVALSDDESRTDVRVLHGRTPTGTALSLHGVRLFGGEKEHPSGRAHVRFVADRLIVGAAVDDEADVSMALVRVSFRGLREWLMGWTRDTKTPLPLVTPEEGTGVEGSNRRVDDWVRSASVDIDDVRLQAIVSRDFSATGRFRTVYDTSAWLQLTSTGPLSLADWRRSWIEPLRDLVLFGTREQTVILSLEGETSLDHTSTTVKVFMAPEVVVQPPQHTPYYQRDLLPAGIWDQDGFEDLVSTWRSLHLELGAVAQAFFELANGADVPPLTRLLRLTSCAEGYHRILHDEPPFSDVHHSAMLSAMVAALPDDETIRAHYRDRLTRANSQSQRRRIRWLIERGSQADSRLTGHARKLTSQLVGWRNDHTHLEGSATAPPLENLLLLNAVLAYVMAANILLDLGMGDNTLYCLRCGHAWDDPVAALAS